MERGSPNTGKLFIFEGADGVVTSRQTCSSSITRTTLDHCASLRSAVG